MKLSALTLLVRDYDEAIVWYCEKLGFSLIEDTSLGDGKRWVVVAAGAKSETRLLLAKAVGEKQTAQIGCQAGGRVFLFVETDDFQRDHQRMMAAGVTFQEPPRSEAYGTVAVFADLYGNLFDLIEPAPARTEP